MSIDPDSRGQPLSHIFPDRKWHFRARIAIEEAYRRARGAGGKAAMAAFPPLASA